MTPSVQPLAEELCKRYEALKTERSAWDGLWQEIGDFVMPRKAQITSFSTPPNNDKERLLFDSTAVQANMILANGQLSWMTPHETPWFALEAPRQLNSDRVKRWLHVCTEELRLALAKSNFYTEIHELYLNRGGFGTGAMYVEDDGRGGLFFDNLDLGSFVCAEDHLGFVDTVFRDLGDKTMTLRACVQKFGLESLSDGLQQKYKSGGSEWDKPVEIIHAVFPRDDAARMPGKLDALNMPVASVYFERATKHVVRQSGYEEMPCMVTRFLKWMSATYGWSPSWVALSDSKQLNFIQKMMDVLAEVSAFPRMLVPSSLEAEIDTRAHGVTYYDENSPGGKPQEWLTQGRYDIGKDRIAEKQAAINKAFHVDLFAMFAQMEARQMTAREVAERASEKLTQFSPTFGRITSELLEPLIQRVFSLMLRGGFLPPPPPEAVIPLGDGTAFVPPPNIIYSSRIALAIRSLHNTGYSRTLEHMAPIMASRPDVLDNMDVDRAIRDMMRYDGVPPEWLLEEEQVAKIRAARAKQLEQQARLQAAESLAASAGKVGLTADKLTGRAA